jgi:hypothetical protein
MLPGGLARHNWHIDMDIAPGRANERAGQSQVRTNSSFRHNQV